MQKLLSVVLIAGTILATHAIAPGSTCPQVESRTAKKDVTNTAKSTTRGARRMLAHDSTAAGSTTMKDKQVGQTKEGKAIYQGRRGGRYYVNEKGKKVYLRKANKGNAGDEQ